MSVEIEVQSSSTGVDNTLRRLTEKFRFLNREAAKVGVTASKLGTTKVNTAPAVRELTKLNQQFERTNLQITRTTSSIIRNVQRAAVGLAVAFGSNTLKNTLNNSSDQMTEMANRIALVTGRTKELGFVQDELIKVAKRSNGSMEAAGEVFNRFGLALKDSTYNTSDFLKATETIQKGLALGGGSAESARAAIMQLGQGLGAGALRGEELNSVMEQAAPVARAIAAEMGIAYGELRQVAQEGRITADVVMSAMLNQAEDINTEFEKLNKTVSKTKVVLGDSFTRFFARVDGGLGLSQSTIAGYSRLSDWLDRNNDAAEQFAFAFRVNVLHAIRDVFVVADGIGAILTASFKRLAKAIPAVILPMRTLVDDIELMVTGMLLHIYQGVGRFGLSIRAALAAVVDESILEGFNALFRASNAYEARDALYLIAEAIESLGLRWYNIGNRLEVFFRQVRIGMIEWGVYLGLIDQKLVRLRYKSIERLGTLFEIAGVAMREFIKNFKFSPAVFKLLIGIKTGLQLIHRVFEALLNDIGEAVQLDTVLKKFSDFTGSLQTLFYKTYMYIVGNSIWKDMLNEMRSYASVSLDAIARVFVTWKNKIVDSLTGIESYTNFTLDLVYKVMSINAVLEHVGGYFYGIGMVLQTLLIWANKVAGAFEVLIPMAIKMGREFARLSVSFTGRALESSMNLVSRAAESASGYVKALYDRVAGADLSRAANVVKNFAKTVEGWFFWVYDKVIGHSWWTDTMEQTYALAVTHLSRTISVVQQFANSVVSWFRKAYQDIAANKLDGLINQIRGLKDIIVVTFTKGFLVAWKAVNSMGEEMSYAFGTLMLSTIVGIFSKKKLASLITLSAASLGAATLGATLPQVAGQLIDSGFIEDLIKPIGQAIGQIVAAGIANIPVLVDLMFEAGAAFVTGFFDNFGAVGNAINSLLDTVTFGMTGAVAAAAGLILMFGKFATLKTVASTIFSAFTTPLDKLKGKDGKGGPTGIIGSLLYGKANSHLVLVAGLASILGVSTGLVNTLNPLANIFGIAGMMGVLLFGAHGSGQLIIQTAKDAVSAVYQLASGRIIPPTSLLSRWMYVDDKTTSDVQASINAMVGGIRVPRTGPFQTMMEFLKLPLEDKLERVRSGLSAAFDPGRLARFRENLVLFMQLDNTSRLQWAASIFPDSVRTKIMANITAVKAYFTATTAKINATAATAGGAMGAMGKVLFGKTGRILLIIAGILGLSAASANASTGLQESMLSGSSLIEFGLWGTMLFGLAGPEVLGGAVRKLATTAGGALSTVGSMTFGKKGLITRVLLGVGGSIGSVLGGIGAAISGFFASLFSLPVLIGGAIAASIGLIGIMLFGEGDGPLDRLSNFGSKIRDMFTDTTRRGREARAELEGLLTIDKVGEIEIDLKSKLEEVNLSFASDDQLREIRRTMATANKVFERNQAVFREEGALSRAEQRETTRAVRLVQNALNKVPTASAAEIAADSVKNVRDIFRTLGVQAAPSGNVNPRAQGLTQYSVGPTNAVSPKQLRQDFSRSGFGDISLPAGFEWDNEGLGESLLRAVEVLEQDSALGGKLTESLRKTISESLSGIAGRSQELESLDLFDRQAATIYIDNLRKDLDAAVTEAADSLRNSVDMTALMGRRDAIQADLQDLFGEGFLSDEDKLGLSGEAMDKLEERIAMMQNNPVFADPLGLTSPKTQKQVDQLAAEMQRFEDIISVGVGQGTSKAAEELTNFAEWMQGRLGNLDIDMEFITPDDETEMRTAIAMVNKLEAAAKRLSEGKGSRADAQSYLADLERAQLEIPLLLGSTKDQVSAILELVDNSKGIDEAMNLSPKTLERVVALGRAVANLMAIINSGGLDMAGVDASIGQKVREKMQGHLDELGRILGESDSGGGSSKKSGGSSKTFWEKFREGLSSAGFSLEDEIIGRLPKRLLDQLVTSAGRYNAAQKAINNSTAGEVALRKQSLDIMQQARQTIAETLSNGNLGAIQGTLDSFGISIDTVDLLRMSSAEMKELIDAALRLEELNNQAVNSTAEELANRQEIANEMERIQNQIERATGETESFGSTVRSEFESSLSKVLKGASSIKEMMFSILDSLTSKILDKFSEGITDAIFDGMGVEDTINQIFKGVDFSDLSKGVEGALGEGAQKGGGILNNLFSMLLGSGGGGGLFSSLFGLSFGSFLGFANGGYVSGPGGPREDAIPAMLSNGEYVINASSTRRFLPILDAINSGRTPAFAKGGPVGPVNPKAATSSAGRKDTLHQEFTIQVTGDVSRQTRSEVAKMITDIANGVNAVNREKGNK